MKKILTKKGRKYKIICFIKTKMNMLCQSFVRKNAVKVRPMSEKQDKILELDGISILTQEEIRARKTFIPFLQSFLQSLI